MEKNIENEYINEVSYTDPNNRYNINYNINFHDNKLNNTTIIKNMNNKNIHYNSINNHQIDSVYKDNNIDFLRVDLYLDFIFSNNTYKIGNTIRVRNVALNKPPITTVAKGFCTSAPAP